MIQVWIISRFSWRHSKRPWKKRGDFF